MKLIELNNKNLSVPETWNELSARQLLRVMHILFIEDYSTDRKVLELQRVLFGMKKKEYRKLPAEDIDEFLYLVNFLLEGKIDLTKNVFPKITHVNRIGTWQDFYGAEDECMNMIAFELVFAESYFMKW